MYNLNQNYSELPHLSVSSPFSRSFRERRKLASFQFSPFLQLGGRGTGRGTGRGRGRERGEGLGKVDNEKKIEQVTKIKSDQRLKFSSPQQTMLQQINQYIEHEIQ